MFQDPRAEAYEKLCLSLSDRVSVGSDLMQHLLHGQVMHPSEAAMRIEVLAAKAQQNAVCARSIRRHQKKLGISSLEWRELSYCGYSVRVPQINDSLNPTKQDVATIRENTASIIDFLDNIAPYFRVWVHSDRLARDKKYSWKEVPWEGIETHLHLCDWVDVHHLDAIVTCISNEGTYDRPTNRFTISGYDFLPTAHTSDREPWIWVQLNNERPSL